MPRNKIRRRGPFAPLSAHYYKDDAILRAGERAEVLFTRGLAFQSEQLRDGIITDAQLSLLAVGLAGVKGRASKLVEVGLWERVDGGYNIRAWLDWNQSRAEIDEALGRDADRKRPGQRPTPPPPDEPPPDGEDDPFPWDSERNPDGDSDRNPDGNETESDGLTRAGARRPARARSRSRSTSRDRAAAREGEVTTRERPTAAAAAILDSRLPAGTAPADRGRLLGHVTAALAEGVPADTVALAVDAWIARDDCTPGLLPHLIGDAARRSATHADETAAADHLAARRAWRAEVAACDACDDSGWVDTDTGLRRCDRHPAPPSTSTAGAAS